ncbi:hypothetical protein ACWGB8_37230, partial [Kitasatospora sp. NPDC054939]
MSALIGGVFGYVGNAWLMAVRYEGTNVPSGSPVTSDGTFVQGALFWGLCSTVIFGVAGYWRAMGTRAFLTGVRGVPTALTGLVRGDRAAYVHLLWGAAISMIAATVVSPSLGAMLAIGLLTVIPGVLGSVISSAIHHLWSVLVQRIAPTRRHKVGGVTGMTVGLLGSAAALLLAFLLPSLWLKLALAGLFALAAVLIGVFGRPPSAGVAVAVVLLLGTAVGFVLLAQAPPASADDAGWAECKEMGVPWLECTGIGKLLANSAVGAAVAAAGAIIGTWLGQAAAALTGLFGGTPPDDGGERRGPLPKLPGTGPTTPHT